MFIWYDNYEEGLPYFLNALRTNVDTFNLLKSLRQEFICVLRNIRDIFCTIICSPNSHSIKSCLLIIVRSILHCALNKISFKLLCTPKLVRKHVICLIWSSASEKGNVLYHIILCRKRSNLIIMISFSY